ncbi:GntR family transcriptional regulator [Synergistes jonesii]|uniref:GntR family transcriptional regulator n=1 Tax=Synergistes jonesii TaxID=2754 RepID=UPI002A76204B|nr:GntR family transcriptional regulator [Synergistes jonesii]MDY2985719.1 GntR family transcriptional regulator [Synergistes jonesii]
MTIIADVVVDKIKSILFSGEYAPNDHINIEEIARKCGCSKTPVREALKKLNSDGFVAYEPKIGFSIKYLSLSEYLKKYELQELLEVYLIRKIAELPGCVNFEGLYELNENIKRMFKENMLMQIADENDKLHIMLYEKYPNEVIVDGLRRVWYEVKMQRNLMFCYPRFALTIAREHDKIFEALRNGDPQAAEEAMLEHYRSGREAILYSQKW